MISRWWRAVDRAGGGLWLDFTLYAAGAAFAGLTAATSTLAPHRAWGAIAVAGYAVAAAATAVQFRFSRGTATRAAISGLAWVTTTLVPLVVLAAQRAGGRPDRAQEEVLVVEQAGHRLLDSGTPYLARDAIAALPPDQWLLGYLPYQPGMALFGLPHALAGHQWWTDARVWFALATAAALALAAAALLREPADPRPGPADPMPEPADLRPGPADPHRGPAVPMPEPAVRLPAPRGPGPRALPPRGPVAPPLVLRGLQGATVLPVCALTLATGGDDLPVLALCLLALALCARGRFGAAGVAAGAAGALKLFAWPVILVLAVLALAARPVRAPRSTAPAATPPAPATSAPTLQDRRLGAGSVARLLLRRRNADLGGAGMPGAPRRGVLPRFAAGAAGLPLLALLPGALLDARALLDNVVRFPLGDGLVSSPAQSPFPGYLIATSVPGGRAVAMALLLAAGAAVAVHLLWRPPRTAAAAAAVSAWGLLAAILLMPSTRFGYLLYPAALALWAPALAPRGRPRVPHARTAPPADPAAPALGERAAGGAGLA